MRFKESGATNVTRPSRAVADEAANEVSYVEVPCGRIAYEVTGQGPLVVLSHGIGDLRRSYRLLTPLLVNGGYRVVAADLRGHGDSTVGWESISRSDVAGDLLALIWHGALLSGFPASAIDALVGLTGPDTGTLLTSVEVVHLGGALARPAPGGGAQPSIDANYLLTAVGATPTPDLAAAVRAQAHAVKDAVAPWHASYDYYNSEETPAPASAVLPPASYRRLQKINAAYDPDQTIISAHPVRTTQP
jgi:pimeloyl-ACP methyl ester carboxylesterase